MNELIMTSITIPELKRKKGELEGNIISLIKDFMIETGVDVDDIYYDIRKTFGGNPIHYVFRVNLKLNIGD